MMDALRAKLMVKDHEARADFTRLVTEEPDWILETSAEAPCDLLVCEITREGAEKEFDLVSAASAANRSCKVFLVSGLVDPGILLRALRLGAKEFLSLPLDAEEVRSALRKFRSRNGFNGELGGYHEKEGTLVHLMGSKGGIGTTTLAVNLAASLVRSGREPSVALVDMNLLFGDVAVFLGIQSFRYDWAEIARNITRLDRSFLEAALHRHRSGIQVLPSPTGILRDAPFAPDIADKLFGLMRTMFDYVIIDGGQGLGEMSMATLKLADRILIVSLLNLPCLVNVKRLRDTFDEIGYPPDDRIHIVGNRCHRRSSGIAPEDAEHTLKKKVTWTLPDDFQSTMDAINSGKTLHETAPKSELNRKISEIADYLEDRPAPEARKAGFFERFFPNREPVISSRCRLNES